MKLHGHPGRKKSSSPIFLLSSWRLQALLDSITASLGAPPQPSTTLESPLSHERGRSRNYSIPQSAPIDSPREPKSRRNCDTYPRLSGRRRLPVIRYPPSVQSLAALHGHLSGRWPTCSSTETDARRQRYTWHQLWSSGREHI
jgi:hypothetical protein